MSNLIWIFTGWLRRTFFYYWFVKNMQWRPIDIKYMFKKIFRSSRESQPMFSFILPACRSFATVIAYSLCPACFSAAGGFIEQGSATAKTWGGTLGSTKRSGKAWHLPLTEGSPMLHISRPKAIKRSVLEPNSALRQRSNTVYTSLAFFTARDLYWPSPYDEPGRRGLHKNTSFKVAAKEGRN